MTDLQQRISRPLDKLGMSGLQVHLVPLQDATNCGTKNSQLTITTVILLTVARIVKVAGR
jgi:hypothetical protein